MLIKNIDNVEKENVTMSGANNVLKQIPLSKNDGTPAYSFRVFTIGTGGNTPYHNHPYEHLNYVISGNGFLVDEDGSERLIKTGDFAIVMPDEKHQFKNKSDNEDLIIICAVPKEFE